MDPKEQRMLIYAR